jgi:hypothetical protein
VALLGIFDDPERDKFFARVMMLVISELRQEFKREVERVEREVREVRAALATELTLRSEREAARAEGEVTDLPNFWRRDAA